MIKNYRAYHLHKDWWPFRSPVCTGPRRPQPHAPCGTWSHQQWGRCRSHRPHSPHTRRGAAHGGRQGAAVEAPVCSRHLSSIASVFQGWLPGGASVNRDKFESITKNYLPHSNYKVLRGFNSCNWFTLLNQFHFLVKLPKNFTSSPLSFKIPHSIFCHTHFNISKWQ